MLLLCQSAGTFSLSLQWKLFHHWHYDQRRETENSMDFPARALSATKSIFNVLHLRDFAFMYVAFNVFFAFIPVALQSVLH